MRKRNTAILFTAVIVASSFGAGSLLAQEDNQQEVMEGNDMHSKMMQEGGMHDMMGDMSAMMEKCNAMMENMQQGHEKDDA
ncbi:MULTISPECIES: hypothetical protein [Halomonadaceae]|uniref:Pentapeptide MXKDX repeat protein n=1 Tax=Vreelandella subterranea TaxID=416874 RepID=A0A1H9REY4_9GAMM|nr:MULTISPECIES: hypothetical protein [Halomonas]MCO7246605.1 DUF4175 domain-containing protein [Halomonas sp. Mc5H-6]SER71214.1 hypothetical protein SAMN04487958_102356 [Halomonas subterranea]